MKLIDNKGKLFGIINAIDFFVILLVIAIGLGTYYKFGVMDKTSTNVAMEPISYTVEIKKVRDYIFNNVKVGDELYDKTSGNSIGTITDIDSEVAKDIVEMVDGKGVYGEVENRYDVLLTVEAEGVVKEEGYFVNKVYELVVGSKKKFVTKYFECEGSVRNIINKQ